MRILVGINCHAREFEARMQEVDLLRDKRPQDQISVVTTAYVPGRPSSYVWSIPHSVTWHRDHEVEEAGETADDAAEVALWRAFCSDRHIFDLADIAGYSTRAFDDRSLHHAFLVARRVLRGLIDPNRFDLILPGAPDNYMSAMSVLVAQQVGLPALFTGGSEICGAGNLTVLNTLSLGNTKMRQCLRDKSPGQGDGSVSAHDRWLTISSALESDLPSLNNAVGNSRRMSIGASLRSWRRNVRGAAGAAVDSVRYPHSETRLLTTTEGTGREAASRNLALVARRILNKRRLRSASMPGFQALEADTRRVLIALHFQPEAYVTFACPELADQLFWVRLLSLALPRDVEILVKEHPAQDLGWRPSRFYNELSALPRVSICPVNSTTRELLESRSIDLVCTLGGSVCVEARSLGIPVVAVLESVSSSFPGVRIVDPFSPDFSRELVAALNSDKRPPRPAEVKDWYGCLDQCTVPVGTASQVWNSLVDWFSLRPIAPGGCE